MFWIAISALGMSELQLRKQDNLAIFHNEEELVEFGEDLTTSRYQCRPMEI